MWEVERLGGGVDEAYLPPITVLCLMEIGLGLRDSDDGVLGEEAKLEIVPDKTSKRINGGDASLLLL